jgi:hypothetical protein
MATKVGNGLDLQGSKIINLGTPSSGTDAATMAWVSGLISGISTDWHTPVRAASVGANVTISAPGASLDAVTLAANDRILLKDQTTASQNGIWVFNSSAAALTRPAGEVFKSGDTVIVAEGTVNDNSPFVLATNGAITVDTTSQSWVALPGSAGVTRSSLGATGKYAQTIGDGSSTSIAVTHGLGTSDVVVSLRDATTNAMLLTDWAATSTTVVTLTFATAPVTNAYRVTIVG